MATVNILVIVDVQGANTPNQGGLANNVWMLDTGRYRGTQEAGNELDTTLNAGDKIVWSLAAIDPGTNLAFASNQPAFTGQAVPQNINPKPDAVDPNQYEAVFEVPGNTPQGTRYQYTMVLSMNGATQSFDPFLTLNTGT